MTRRLVPLLLIAIMASCSGSLPGTSVPGHNARQYFAINDSTPLIALIRQRNIESPTASSPTPILDQLTTEIAKSDEGGKFKGVTYELTRGNTLPRDWIVQSPNFWGRKADQLRFYPLSCEGCNNELSLPSCTSDDDCDGGTCAAIWPQLNDRRAAKRKVCLGHSDALTVQIHDLVASAKHRVDITLLQPPLDERFLSALRNALQTLARRGRPVTVRIVVGQYPPDNVDAAAFLMSMVSALEYSPKARITVSVAAMRSCVASEDCDSYSWNHSKIVTVDGVDALVGGHNMWSKDYLIDSPVHDLSMRVHGPAAASAARFIDGLWNYICSNLGKKPSITLSNFSMGQDVTAADACPPPPAALPAAESAGGLPILAIGRLGAGITKDFANQSELARDLMFGSAQSSIRIVQQDLGFTLGRADVLFPESTLDRLVTFLMKQEGRVYIVLSNEGATGNSGNSYSNGVSLAALAKHLRELVQRRLDALDPTERYRIRKGPDPLNALLCERVHLAPFRFGPDDKWAKGAAIGNHSKFWMVDDQAFYIGSDNMYPINLQEFGYVVDDKKAARELLDAYWNPLWQWSQRAAVSGAGVENCVFRTFIK